MPSLTAQNLVAEVNAMRDSRSIVPPRTTNWPNRRTYHDTRAERTWSIILYSAHDLIDVSPGSIERLDSSLAVSLCATGAPLFGDQGFVSRWTVYSGQG